MDEHIPTTPRNNEAIEKAPKVEHLFFSNNTDVLIKTSFPRGDARAICYILIQEPTSETGVKNFNEGLEVAPESSRPNMKIAFEAVNKPLVFTGFDQVQWWFDNSKHLYNPPERKRIADFLGVDEQDHS
ncbi:MAG: hypothetical protein Q8P23_03375 [bacterium]|nr:hypothetical protein [bacterium]